MPSAVDVAVLLVLGTLGWSHISECSRPPGVTSTRGALPFGVRYAQGAEVMKAAQWVRLVVLSFAVMSVAGLIAVLACGPSAPSAPPNGAGNVSDSVSLPTEVPFMLPQSGDGGNGEPTAEPTEEPTPTQYVPPTVRPSECKGSGRHRRREWRANR